MAPVIELGRFSQVATDRTTASSIRKSGSESQGAVDERVQGVAANIIASDPTIINAALDAVDDAAANAGFLNRRQLGAVRTIQTDDPLFSEVHLSADFRRLGGVLRTGGDVVAASGGAIAYATPTGTGEVSVTRDFRRAEPGADASGLTPQAVLDGWAERMPAGAGFAALTGWGDSMTTDYGSVGVNQTIALAEGLGVTGHDRGVSGDTPTQIAWRMGALPWRITVPGGTIPASGTVPVVVDPPRGHRQARSWPCIVTTSDGVEVRVVLAHASTTPNAEPSFTIQQTAGAGTVAIMPGTRIEHEQGRDYAAQSAPATIWMGRNDLDLGRLEAALRAMLSQHRDPARRRLVRPVFNRSTEPAGSPGYATVMAVNDLIADIAGADYYDDRSALIAHGLSLAGITPTPEDDDAIADDQIPPSLMLDGLHLNNLGRNALARIDTIEINGRNW